jgi:hypothetical protein
MKKIAFVSFLAFGCGLLQADVIYSNFGVSPAAPFDTGAGLTVSSGGTDLSTAMAFLVTGNSYLVTQIDFVASLFSGTNSVTATIYQGTGAPGTPGTSVCTTGPINNAMGSFANPSELEIPVVCGQALQAGDYYWLSLDSNASDSTIRWNYNGQGVIGTGATFNGTNWIPTSVELGAFELDGTVASPEPITIILLVSGMAVLVAVRRRRLV